jgi:hypothetical protein
MKHVKLFEAWITESKQAEQVTYTLKELDDDQFVVLALKANKQVGRLDFIKSKFKKVLKATIVNVDPNHRREGIGTQMYIYAETQLGLKFTRNDDVLTPDGKSIWNQKSRPFGL